MDGVELIRSALDGLSSHKLRSGLTGLGVIFGVAAVISMASIGEGARREALKQIERMGVGNIIIDENLPEEGDELLEAKAKSPMGLTMGDADAIREVITDARLVVPIRKGEFTVTGRGNRAKVMVIATTPDFFKLYDINPSAGRPLNWKDEIDFRRVCVLGWSARRALFPLKDPLGDAVKVLGHPFTVVGVVGKRAISDAKIEGIDLRNENMDVYVPVETSLVREPAEPGTSELSQIIVQMKGPGHLAKYAAVIKRVLNRRHREIEDFSVVVPEELLHQHQQTQRIFNIVMGTIASISLLVGGIGIMNIMLASVLERTREIGIRRAVGAKQSDIARQFLLEAILLSLSGGLIGVVVGILLAQGISLYANWETAVSVWAIVVSVGVSASVGIVFGWLPARRAAKLDPITALRYE